MNTSRRIITVLILIASQVVTAGGANHQYWVCGVTAYQSIVGGKTQAGQCSANTAYSQPPCREFVVEFAGANGIRPGASYQQSANGVSTRIEITKADGYYAYNHTINKAGNRWSYQGKCRYFEAPIGEKIHMDHGLKTQP
ncbi:MAG: hypothetical protein FJ190_10630 [Gammaproteobacteria bacterium]|nr:hypothetical protein [Gammaproteobacteria bacterium]